jgi:predicted kinase
VVSGTAGTGKTTLAHALARAVGCPAICRDEIKEGMAHATPDFVPRPGDELTMRTLPVFFRLLEVLIGAGVTTVAEAAFQDRLWRQGLAPLRDLARIRVVHCVVSAELAWARTLLRGKENPLRRVHADPGPEGEAKARRHHAAFDRVSLEVPSIEVDTTAGYRPALEEIVAFARGVSRR